MEILYFDFGLKTMHNIILIHCIYKLIPTIINLILLINLNLLYVSKKINKLSTLK